MFVSLGNNEPKTGVIQINNLFPVPSQLSYFFFVLWIHLELADNGYKSYLAKHHEKSDDPFLKCFQKYDQQAAILTRKIRSPRTNRYTWASGESLNFDQLATEIQEVSDNIWKLYDYIYNSKELTQVTESLQYGHSSLRDHLLVLTNLVVRDAQVEHF